ncbi:MAG: M50 family metallopeptidase [Planctomycetes bacterium]|nr:M50 family metallopeptidase [Planctomycetota bacterium]
MGIKLLKSMLLCLGSIVFGRCFPLFIHEHGHAIGALMTGGKVLRIYFHPFSWSQAFCIGSSSEIFVTFAGSALTAIVGVLVVLSVWRWRKYYVTVLYTGAVFMILKDGFYYLNSVANNRGDAVALIGDGVPEALVISFGLLLFVGGAFFAIECFNMLGFDSNDGVWYRFLVLSGGIGPYLVSMLVYHVKCNDDDLNRWLMTIGLSVVMIFVLSLLSGIAQRKIRLFRVEETKTVSWGEVVFANVLASSLALVMFLILPMYSPYYDMIW